MKYSIIPKLYCEGAEENLIMYDNIENLEGKTLQVQVIIHSARGLPANFVDELMCRYKWIDESAEEFETTAVASRGTSADLNYERLHDLYVSSYVVSHIWDGSLSIGAYGKLSRSGVAVSKKSSDVNKVTTSSEGEGKGRRPSESSAREMELKPVTSNDPLVLRRELELYSCFHTSIDVTRGYAS